MYKNKKLNNFFNDKDLLEKIIDKIRYISYKTTFFGVTNTNTLRIYEYGIFSNIIENKSILLLIYYGGHIVVNIHEIGGHIYVKLENFYCCNYDYLSSPKIDKHEEKLFSDYAIKTNLEKVLK